MNKNVHSKTSLFLMEIIIAIMFFSLASAVCVKLFVGAHLLSQQDHNLNCAIEWSQNFSESFVGCKGRILMIKNLYPSSFLSMKDEEFTGTISLFFNEDWEPIDNSLADASYQAMIDIHRDSAENVYADVNEYGIPLKGDAMVGEIVILDIRDKTEGFTEIPDDPSFIVFDNKVDYYIGEY